MYGPRRLHRYRDSAQLDENGGLWSSSTYLCRFIRIPAAEKHVRGKHGGQPVQVSLRPAQGSCLCNAAIAAMLRGRQS